MQKTRKKIMLVDDNISNLTVGKNALSDKYDVFTIPSGEKLFHILQKMLPDLILLDIEMPGMSGYEVIRILKADKRTANIPVIFLTAKNDAGSELEGLSLGAVDYIAKPLVPPLLSKRIDLHLLVECQKAELEHYNENLQKMVLEKTRRVTELQNAVLETVAELVEWRDDITGGHIERTQRYLNVLVKEMMRQEVYQPEVSGWDIDLLLQSAQLHDVGKIAIRDSILRKPGKLTAEEFEEMKMHTTFGVKVIEKIEESTSERTFLNHAKVFAGTHHEKWDGSGYPLGLRGRGIPLQGRLMAVADVYDALITVRPYKSAYSHEESVSIIMEGKGSHFDPALVDLFGSVTGEFKEISRRVGGVYSIRMGGLINEAI